jgi:hypothetical protein
MSVVVQSFSASFGNVYNIAQAPDPTSLPQDKFLVVGTPTNNEIIFGATINGTVIKGIASGDFQYPLGLPKNLLEANANTTGSATEFKIYANNVLMQKMQYSPAVTLKNSDLADRDKTVAAKVYAGDDTFIGATDVTKNDGSDTVDGFDGNDIFYGNGSGKYSDIFYGGNGIDTSVFRGKLSNYTVSTNSAVWNQYTQKSELKGFDVIDKVGADGQQQISGVERLKFSDSSVALDLDGNAGIAVKILGAVFGKSAVTNKAYVGIALDLLDKGISYDTLAGLALGVVKATSNDQIVTALWTNVVGSAPSAADKAPFVKLLQDGMSAGSLAHLAADTALNTNSINLVGLAQTGIEYTAVS